LSEILFDSEAIRVRFDTQTITFPRVPLPAPFLEWQSAARLRMCERLAQEGARSMRSQPVHLPVLASMGAGPFPINLATRGIGLLPKPEYLETFTVRFESVIRAAAGQPWEATLPQRAAAVCEFYAEAAHADPWVLGGLEIFEGQTPANLRRNPLAALLYTGEPPAYPSYQFDGVVQFVEGDDPRFRFLLAARELFAQDAFHIHQIHYPHGYLFYPVGIRDKTPYPRREHVRNMRER
jgi:hypothetical protein